MNAQTRRYLIDGPAGKIEIALDAPEGGVVPRGIALIAHPHPLFGGTLDNKVVQTLARGFIQLGYLSVRSNFRGVGGTEGTHDDGQGEQDDLLAVLDHVRADPAYAFLPLALAGFSFGTYVLSHLAKRLAAAGRAAERLVLVGTAASRWQVAEVPVDTLVIHGEQDDTVPIASVYDWARPQKLPVIVIPGAEHFFHRKLHILKRVVTESWRV